MAPLCVYFIGSVGKIVGADTIYPYVSTKINHQYSGKRVRIKILSFVHRPAANVFTYPLRMDFSTDFYANGQGVVTGINRETTGITYNGVNYYQNNTGVGLIIPGSATSIVRSFFGNPTYEGILLSPELEIFIRPLTVAPTVTEVANDANVATSLFGYASLMLDIETLN